MAHLTSLATAAALATTLAACGDDPDDVAPIVDSGEYRHYVQTSWDLPRSGETARAYAHDFDGDGAPENQIGGIVGALQGFGLDLTTANAEAFASGELVILHSTRADSQVDDPSVSWQLMAGLPAATPPRFDGSDRFGFLADGGLLLGSIKAGKLEGRYGNVVLRVPFFPGQHPLPMPLSDARVVLDLTNGGCKGHIAGIISKADRDAIILPVLAAQAVTHLGKYPDHEFTRSATRVFDGDRNGTVTTTEVAAVTRGFIGADVELDRDGMYDSAGDAISVGLGFTCAPATFTVPGE